jgi:Raf kinase inhibitor-like YbhB/YbcL family protein
MLRKPAIFVAAVATLSGANALAAQQGFSLTSPTVAEGKALPNDHVLNGFGCTGGNLSPELHWANAPAGTKSFALQVYDPDAPTGSGWWHWVVVDIPATAKGLPRGVKAGAVAVAGGGRQTRTDFGAAGFGGACPPPGAPHRYVFTLTALDVDRLPVPDDASGAMVGFTIGAHTLGKAVLTANFGRK